ncbi:MAG: glycosyltransferase [Coriobacteriia bacterium]|nr:glycosyltransferase [Coriobacteriia bacterium]MCL2750920.1 glycosyltransferase [Coriobacteriia bacterium]
MSKILMVHGYVLCGTGSNLYVRNIVRNLCEMGQDVVLVCQEFTPEDYDFIARHVAAKGDDFREVFERETPYPGKCEIYVPDTANELLVYVYDRYKDMLVQEMKDVSEGEIQDYIRRNAATIAHICAHNDISKAYSNHLVLQPQYVAEGIKAACSKARHIIIGHGSDLNYAISKREYLDALSRVTLASCDQLVAVSHHSKQAMQDYYDDLDLSACAVINAGLDEQLYGDMPLEEERLMLAAYIDAADQGHGFSAAQSKMIAEMVKQGSFDFAEVQASYEAKDIEVSIKDKLFDMLYVRDNQKLVYLGKYLEQKGLIPLVLGLPFLYAHNPKINFILVGFGAFRAQLEYILQLIKLDKLEVFFANARALGVNLEQDFKALEVLREFLLDPENKALYQKGAALLDTNTLFTGYFDQRYAVRVLHSAEVSIFPSIYPEAFGMVIIEAMAAKVKPLCTRHSGFKETLETAASSIPGMSAEDFSVPLDEQILLSIVEKALALLSSDNKELTDQMSEFALNNYGWMGITKKLMEL